MSEANYTPRWQRHLSTNEAPEVPLYTHDALVSYSEEDARVDLDTCKRCACGNPMDDDEARCPNCARDVRLAEAIANPEVARQRTMAQIARYHRERAS